METELDDLVAIVEAGLDAETDGVVRWRCTDLTGVIADRFGVTLSERSVGRLLNDRGYVRLKPRPQHLKADSEAQAAFKKLPRGGSRGAARACPGQAARDLVPGRGPGRPAGHADPGLGHEVTRDETNELYRPLTLFFNLLPRRFN